MINIRNYQVADETAVNALAVNAFEEYSGDFNEWPEFCERLKQFSAMAVVGQLMVARQDNEIIGAVAYVPAKVEKPAHFPVDTPIIRVLVVHPKSRGLGIGRRLTHACIELAIQDGCHSIALHTSPIMKIALPMYLRLGFEKTADAPDINGVKYAVYVKKLI